MIATIQTASTSMQGVGIFEAMKFGLETERYADNTFDLVAHDMDKVMAIATKCNGKILSINDGYVYPTYES
jgi:hypothetical protein